MKSAVEELDKRVLAALKTMQDPDYDSRARYKDIMKLQTQITKIFQKVNGKKFSVEEKRQIIEHRHSMDAYASQMSTEALKQIAKIQIVLKKELAGMGLELPERPMDMAIRERLVDIERMEVLPRVQQDPSQLAAAHNAFIAQQNGKDHRHAGVEASTVTQVDRGNTPHAEAYVPRAQMGTVEKTYEQPASQKLPRGHKPVQMKKLDDGSHRKRGPQITPV